MHQNQDLTKHHPNLNHRLNNSPQDRREIDRRLQPSEGYMHIGVVGWICRREKSRRQEDRPIWAN